MVSAEGMEGEKAGLVEGGVVEGRQVLGDRLGRLRLRRGQLQRGERHRRKQRLPWHVEWQQQRVRQLILVKSRATQSIIIDLGCVPDDGQTAPTDSRRGTEGKTKEEGIAVGISSSRRRAHHSGGSNWGGGGTAGDVGKKQKHPLTLRERG